MVNISSSAFTKEYNMTKQCNFVFFKYTVKLQQSRLLKTFDLFRQSENIHRVSIVCKLFNSQTIMLFKTRQ